MKKYKMIAFLLIILDLFIKVIIGQFFPHMIDKCYHLFGMVDFYPRYNYHRTGINSLFKINSNFAIYLMVITVGILLLFSVLSYVKYLVHNQFFYPISLFALYLVIGCNMERLLIAITNHYVLDYIGLFQILIIDLVDGYLCFALVVFIVNCIEYRRGIKYCPETKPIPYLKFIKEEWNRKDIKLKLRKNSKHENNL